MNVCRYLLVPIAIPVALLAGCVSTPDFAEESEVDRPRVLAIVADPPEVAPGEPSALSLMLAGFGTREPTVTWSACAAFENMIGGTQYGDRDDEAGCGGGFAFALGEGRRATLPGEPSAALFDNLELAREALGALLPEGTVEKVRDQVGLPLTVEARVAFDGVVFRATKKVIVNAARQHTNPPSPHFDVEGQEVVTRDDAAFECEAAEGGPLPIEADAVVELAPRVDGDEEPWLEPYQVLDARGDLQERQERGFYSWYSDGGRLDSETTKSPLRNNLYRTPAEPGCYSLWVVVRDGHGGTSACRLPLAVGEAECELP